MSFHLFSLLISLWCCSIVATIPIDNGVEGDPEIECSADSIVINFNTRNAFQGHVYVKGRYEEAGCRNDEGGRNTAGIKLGFEQCGTQRSRSLNPKGVFVSNTVVITFHPQFLTKVDRAYTVQCFYMEADKTVSQELEVSEITTLFQTQLAPMPVCRYEILDGGPEGQPIKFATIGQLLYHKWTCETETTDMFCAVVHSCFVDDGADNRVQLLDENGCALDRFLLQNLEYPSDLVAGQEAMVFKYADKPALFFQCQVTIAVKEPTEQCTRPQCGEPPGPAPGASLPAPAPAPAAQPAPAPAATVAPAAAPGPAPAGTAAPAAPAAGTASPSLAVLSQRIPVARLLRPQSAPASPPLSPELAPSPQSNSGVIDFAAPAPPAAPGANPSIDLPTTAASAGGQLSTDETEEEESEEATDEVTSGVTSGATNAAANAATNGATSGVTGGVTEAPEAPEGSEAPVKVPSVVDPSKVDFPERRRRARRENANVAGTWDLRAQPITALDIDEDGSSQLPPNFSLNSQLEAQQFCFSPIAFGLMIAMVVSSATTAATVCLLQCLRKPEKSLV